MKIEFCNDWHECSFEVYVDLHPSQKYLSLTVDLPLTPRPDADAAKASDIMFQTVDKGNRRALPLTPRPAAAPKGQTK